MMGKNAALLFVLAQFILGSPAIAGSIQDAVSLPGRLASDRDRDATRKPEAVLRFFSVEPGMTVLDLYSGGGYYTELLARAVGEHGSVVAHNNKAYLAYAKDELELRYSQDRLKNVVRISQENNELDLESEQFDLAVIVLGFHDLYYVDEKNGWPRIDDGKMLAELFESIKPGGTLGIVDHAAKPGAPLWETAQTLHRIDPTQVRTLIEKAGFAYVGESDVLRNPDDDTSKPMFDPAIRGKTDRIVYRFKKP